MRLCQLEKPDPELPAVLTAVVSADEAVWATTYRDILFTLYIHTHTHTYLFEFLRSGAVHRDRCYGDPGDSWGEKEKQDFLNSWGTLSEGGRGRKN